ncbi:hypothetical protein DXZ79_03760 [Yersinia rochesterensis]|uniref:Uncharacterized protein n=1 Tax=Yersinia rochesterensis TaxID=1604335 RepID=A0A8D4SM30_9GAMM|nr:hypothetical protein DXZ79_03760 [Yersinia rochesterensis]
MVKLCLYTRHTSSCMCVGCTQSPESLTRVSSSGFSRLPPSCYSNYLAYRYLSLTYNITLQGNKGSM